MYKQGVNLKNNPFIEIVSKANPDILEEVIDMQAEKTFEEVMRELAPRLGLVDRLSEMQEVARKMLKIGIPHTEIALITDLDIDIIKSL